MLGAAHYFDIPDPAHDPVLLNRLRLLLAWTGDDNIIVSKKEIKCAQTHPVDSIMLKGVVLPKFQAQKLFSKLPEKERKSITYESRRVQNVNYTWEHRGLYKNVTTELGEASELVSIMQSFELKTEIMWLITPDDHLLKMNGISTSDNESDLYRLDVVCSHKVDITEGSFDDLRSGNFLTKLEEKPAEMSNFRQFTVRLVDKARLKSAKNTMFRGWLANHTGLGIKINDTTVSVTSNTGQVPLGDLTAFFGYDADEISENCQIQQGKDIQQFKFTPTVPSPTSDIYDAPLGARVITNLRQNSKGKEKVLKIWPDDGSPEAVTKRMTERRIPASFNLLPFIPCQFMVGIAQAWMERAGSVVGCIDPRVYDRKKCGKLYGVAGHVLDIAGGKSVVTEAITLFPVGGKWLALAKFCFSGTEGGGEYTTSISSEEKSLCERISEVGLRSGESLTVQTQMIR